MTDYSYDIPSKTEMDNNPKKWTSLPLMADDYILKLAKIELGYSPTWINGSPDYNNMQPIFKVVCLPFALKAGGQMRFTDKSEVKPLNHWIFRDIAFGTGFQQDKVTPSFMRALLCYMEGIEVEDNFTVKKPLLLDPQGHESHDEELTRQTIAELKGLEPQNLIGQGYKVVPDIRIYEGRYIGCALEVATNKKGDKTNKIVRFSKLPETFVPPTPDQERELMKDFEERYAKMKAKQATGGVSTASVQNEPLNMAEVPF